MESQLVTVFDFVFLDL